jgi:[acyl-carrier-protein] S-malonyltransferase
MIAAVFSGQGSQYPGMGQELCASSPAARQVYSQAAGCLGFDLLALSAEQLVMPRFTQLAVVTLSLAAWHALQEQDALPAAGLAFAGFSAGEYSALGAAGVLDLKSLLALVSERARLMQEAAEAFPGAMFAVLGLDEAAILAVLDRPVYAGKVFAANFNCPGQVVISGLESFAAACAEDLRAAGARRLTRLQVGGAFHTPWMDQASRQLTRFASDLRFQLASAPLYSNVRAAALTDPDWPEYLGLHMRSPVLWTQEVQTLAHDGCTAWLEFGPGKVLGGLIRKILPGAATLAVEDSKGLGEASAFLHQL